ncbi:MAG: EF-P lysine aminoacylase GenX [Myxococcales bacterium]|nr:EF-P lysine aminoacylase GenX [Myxococcales bacterium]
MFRSVRSWFELHGYVEVQTPCLVPSPAMEEHLFPLAVGDAFLRTSPEFALKGLMARGLGRIYEIGPCFRDREHGPWHRREFTMCEWYRAGAQLCDLMDEVEALVAAATAAVGRQAPPWRRTTVREAFTAATGIDPMRATAEELSDADDSWDDAFLRRWVTDVEPTLTAGVFVADWPASQAALARIRPSADGVAVASRFEAYIDGIELANAFDELVDPAEQRRRFEASNAARIAMGEPPHPVDEALVAAVGQMPRTCGIAMGMDRLVALACGYNEI